MFAPTLAISSFSTVHVRVVSDLSLKRSAAATAETSSANRLDPSARVDDVPPEEVAGPCSRDTEIVATSASGVAVTNRGGGDSWTVSRPERNLLFVIHPWCMLRKSDADRQSEFPPPGFLELLKAKLLAIHRETNGGQHRQSPAVVWRRRRNANGDRTINCWFQYCTTAAFRGQRTKTVAATTVSYPDGPARFDFLTMRQRFAVPRETKRLTDVSPDVSSIL